MPSIPTSRSAARSSRARRSWRPGRNFGSGCSREHAPWALQDYGFEAVVAPSFSDIFQTNCTKIGLLPVELPEDDVRELLDRAPARGDRRPRGAARSRCRPAAGRRFEIDADIRERLLNGWDEIALTELRMDEIERYEHDRERVGPNTADALSDAVACDDVAIRWSLCL